MHRRFASPTGGELSITHSYTVNQVPTRCSKMWMILTHVALEICVWTVSSFSSSVTVWTVLKSNAQSRVAILRSRFTIGPLVTLLAVMVEVWYLAWLIWYPVQGKRSCLYNGVSLSLQKLKSKYDNIQSVFFFKRNDILRSKHLQYETKTEFKLQDVTEQNLFF